MPEFVNKEVKNTAVVRYPCVGKLDSIHLLKAFELGVDGVVVVGCSDSEKFECQYKDIGYWAGKRVGHTCDLLEALGMERDRVTYTELSGEEIDKFDQVVAEAAEKLKEVVFMPVKLIQRSPGIASCRGIKFWRLISALTNQYLQL
jgi:coenzyme F420-reducing hydrogenase delta subunit